MTSHQNGDRPLYQQLQRFLARQQWQDADYETRRMMLAITGADKKDDLLMSRQQILEFPCEALAQIDRLWVESSEGRFGFHPILTIYRAADRDYAALAQQVGWRCGNTWLGAQDIDYSGSAPVGHLPMAWLIPSTFGAYWLARFASPGWRSLLARLEACHLLGEHLRQGV